MATNSHDEHSLRRTCCPCSHNHSVSDMTRRDFLQSVGGAASIGVALTSLSWSSISAAEQKSRKSPKRRALVVKPIFTYPKPQRRPQRSWRNWGGIQTEKDVRAEIARIHSELDQLKTKADFPLEFLPLATIRRPDELVPHNDDIKAADVLLFYAGGDGGGDLMANVNHIDRLGKDVIFFARHKSGPLYYWYEGAMARFLHQHTDVLATKSVGYEDIVIDSLDEILWRLRSLCGLRNTMGTRIIAIGGPGAWAQPRGVVPKLVEDKWEFDMQTVSYDELGKLIKEAKADEAAVRRAKRRAEGYLKAPGISLETKREFVDNAFLLEQVFRGIMKEANCQAITINGCMGTIMPLAETSACLTLTFLNDGQYLAFCESDFVVIPSGVLLANISGKPVFLNDPTYPHDGIITIAHCTAPRKMNGTELEPVRILTHFESDYGAAPKVEMRKGQMTTNIVPDFKAERWVGLLGEIIDAPFMDICRSQIDIRYTCDDLTLAERMPGFHWMTGYGDYMKELGYALKKVGITWENLSA